MPRTVRSTEVGCRVTPAKLAELRAVAVALGLSLSEAVRIAVAQFVARNPVPTVKESK